MPMTVDLNGNPVLLPTQPFTLPATDTPTPALIRQAFDLANAAVIADVQSACPCVKLDGLTWWDSRPMVDPREHPPAVIELAQAALQFGLTTGLLGVHPQRPYLLHITNH